ncbi:MAG TPA: YncE family protein, partial [Chthonomonadales bacterium]|nr:YncE family protein [Chthonomonadales bacterium]
MGSVIRAIFLIIVAYYGACAAIRAQPPLRQVADLRLPGSATRFDYQSLDPSTGRLYLSHMGEGVIVVFDTHLGKPIAALKGFPAVTGVLCVPSRHRLYASVTGNHELAVVDTRSLRVIARIPGPQFPDGIAFDSVSDRVFVSDESGGADYVFDARSNKLLSRISLGGEAGNTQFDSINHRIYVAVQTRNEIASIDPAAMRISGRWPLPGAEGPHGFYIDAPRKLMFVSCEGNAKLFVVDMRTMKETATFSVGVSPDVLAFDSELRRLYVASEAGEVAVFQE